MRINTVNMLFEELTAQERADLESRVYDLIIHGEGTPSEDPYFAAWCDALGFSSYNRLLVYTTVYPQRAALSLLLTQKD